jgi:hypothetical protein
MFQTLGFASSRWCGHLFFFPPSPLSRPHPDLVVVWAAVIESAASALAEASAPTNRRPRELTATFGNGEHSLVYRELAFDSTGAVQAMSILSIHSLVNLAIHQHPSLTCDM